jgi:hypothetical protein
VADDQLVVRREDALGAAVRERRDPLREVEFSGPAVEIVDDRDDARLAGPPGDEPRVIGPERDRRLLERARPVPRHFVRIEVVDAASPEVLGVVREEQSVAVRIEPRRRGLVPLLADGELPGASPSASATRERLAEYVEESLLADDEDREVEFA